MAVLDRRDVLKGALCCVFSSWTTADVLSAQPAVGGIRRLTDRMTIVDGGGSNVLAVGGAVSNALDRLLYGAVADFFHFHWQDLSFYIFNIADVAITCGVLLLLLDFLGIGRPRKS